MTHWAARIFDVRTGAGLSRVDFGLRIGEPDYLVQRWEVDGSEPMVHTALHVARRLGMRVDWLMGPWLRGWDGSFTQSARVGKSETMWRANMIAMAEVAGSRAALAREFMVEKILVQSWIHRRSVPVLRSAAAVSDATGIDLHDLLTVEVDASAGVEHARARRLDLGGMTIARPRYSSP